jgi:hypothetical protein
MDIIIISIIVLVTSLIANKKARQLFHDIDFKTKRNYLIEFVLNFSKINEKSKIKTETKKELKRIIFLTIFYFIGFVYVFYRIA